MEKYEEIFKLLEEGRKQVEISESTGFSINVIKKVSQLMKLYTEIQSYNDGEEILDKVKLLKFKALELKKIANNRELLDECLVIVNKDTKQSEIKGIVAKLSTRSARLKQAKEEYIERKSHIEQELKVEQEIVSNLKNKEKMLVEKYPFLGGRKKKVRGGISNLVGIYKDRFVLKGRLSLDIKHKEEYVKYNRAEKVWEIKDINEFSNFIEDRVNSKESVYWFESEHFKKCAYYDNGYERLCKYDDLYKLPAKIEGFGIIQLENELKKSKKIISELKKQLKIIRSENTENYMEDTLFADSVIDSDIAEHRLVQDAFLKYSFKKGFVAASEITIGNKRFDTLLFKPSKIIIGEIKASRSDFISDKKYMTYMDYCNELYFVLSSNIKIKQDEIEKLKNEGVGLYIVNTKNNTVKKVHGSLTRSIEEKNEAEVINKLLKTLSKKIQDK